MTERRTNFLPRIYFYIIHTTHMLHLACLIMYISNIYTIYNVHIGCYVCYVSQHTSWMWQRRGAPICVNMICDKNDMSMSRVSFILCVCVCGCIKFSSQTRECDKGKMKQSIACNMRCRSKITGKCCRFLSSFIFHNLQALYAMR